MTVALDESRTLVIEPVVVFMIIAETVLFWKAAPQTAADNPREHLKSKAVGSFNNGVVVIILGCWPLSAIKKTINKLI